MVKDRTEGGTITLLPVCNHAKTQLQFSLGNRQPLIQNSHIGSTVGDSVTHVNVTSGDTWRWHRDVTWHGVTWRGCARPVCAGSSSSLVPYRNHLINNQRFVFTPGVLWVISRWRQFRRTILDQLLRAQSPTLMSRVAAPGGDVMMRRKVAWCDVAAHDVSAQVVVVSWFPADTS